MTLTLIKELTKDMVFTPGKIEKSKNHEKMGMQKQSTYLKHLDTLVT
jgi:hypothetical protein